MEKFTPEEVTLLRPYVTNLDKPIFALTSALPQVIAGAGFSRYSRARGSLRRILLDEFLKDGQRGMERVAKAISDADPNIDNTKALEIAKKVYIELLDPSETIRSGEAFYERVLEQFGDESVNELMGGHIALEGVSNILTKVLEDPRLLSPLEKSTRYVVFDVDGFYREPKVMASKHKKIYEETCQFLLKTYTEFIDPMKEFLRKKNPKEDFLFRVSEDSDPISIREIEDETILKAATNAYNRSIRGKYCDVLRYLLPGSTLTNMGIFANGRAHEHLIMKLLASELEEARSVGEAYLNEISKVLPAAVKRIRQYFGEIGIEFYKKRRSAQRELAKELKIGQTRMSILHKEPVRLLHHEDRESAESKVLTALLYEDRSESWEEIENEVKKMTEEERRKVIRKALSGRTNYRHKPPRAFEFTDYTFELLADYGAYRDLQRHRMLTQERQFLTPLHGYATPPELLEADEAMPNVGFKERFLECMERSREAALEIGKDFPLESQYVVAFAYRIRWVKKMHLKEVYHLCELRSGQGGHPSYRKMVQEMARQIQEVHPVLGEGMLIDWKDYDLERSASEIRTEQRVLAREKG
jgi:thymidylate synthase ThyX